MPVVRLTRPHFRFLYLVALLAAIGAAIAFAIPGSLRLLGSRSFDGSSLLLTRYAVEH